MVLISLIIFDALVDVTTELLALLFFFFFWNKVSLCCPGWLQTLTSFHPLDPLSQCWVIGGHHHARQYQVLHSALSFPCKMPVSIVLSLPYTPLWQAVAWRWHSSPLGQLGKGVPFAAQKDILENRAFQSDFKQASNSIFLCILEQGQQSGASVPLLGSKYPYLLTRSHTNSQPARFYPEMKIAITLLLFCVC